MLFRSKDLGISGFRIGILHSHNAALLRAYENLNLTHSASNHTQWVLQHLLTDHEFVSEYVVENRARLTESYAVVVRAMREIGVPYVPSRGSLFAWVDLSEFLTVDSEDGELALWNEIFRSARVLLTPGVGFGHTKRGCFRVVHPCVSTEELAVAMGRLERWVSDRRRGGR